MNRGSWTVAATAAVGFALAAHIAGHHAEHAVLLLLAYIIYRDQVQE